MAYEIFPTTAEHIIGATDAVLLKNTGCEDEFVALFLDIPLESAKNALKMGEQLGLIQHEDGLFYPLLPYANYLVTSNQQQKSAILRLILDQYPPYKTFRNRLSVVELVHTAAEQVKVCFTMDAHRDVIKDTLTSLATYAQSLSSQGAGLYTISESIGERADYLMRITEIVSERERAELIVRKLIGEKAQNWVDQNETLEPLVTSYQMLSNANNDPRGPILYAGNAFESFLVKFAGHHGVSLENATGINGKVDKIARDGHLKSKHKFMAKYLGHVRNACEHGVDIDPEIGQTWGISDKTSHEFVHVTMTCIDVIVDTLDGVYRV